MKPHKSRFAQIFDFGSFESFALDWFKSGVAIRFSDIAFGKYFIYLKTPQNALYPCVIYNALISHKAHKGRQKPIIHFMQCEFLGEILQNNGAKAKIARENAFDYAVGSSEKTSAKLFYGIKLPFCAKCVETYNHIFALKMADFGKDDCNIWDRLFANDLLCAVEMESLRQNGYEIAKAKNHFYLARESNLRESSLHKLGRESSLKRESIPRNLHKLQAMEA